MIFRETGGFERRRRYTRQHRACKVECLSPSRGREYFVFYERSEIKNLVTRDRVAASPQKNNPRIFARGLDCVTLSVLIFEVLLQ